MDLQFKYVVLQLISYMSIEPQACSPILTPSVLFDIWGR